MAASGAQTAQRKAANPELIQRIWAGGNQLYGDGRVRWMPAARFNLTEMAKLSAGAAPPVGGPAIAFRWYYYWAETHVWATDN